jgi:hypothetical protein
VGRIASVVVTAYLPMVCDEWCAAHAIPPVDGEWGASGRRAFDTPPFLMVHTPNFCTYLLPYLDTSWTRVGPS